MGKRSRSRTKTGPTIVRHQSPTEQQIQQMITMAVRQVPLGMLGGSKIRFVPDPDHGSTRGCLAFTRDGPVFGVSVTDGLYLTGAGAISEGRATQLRHALSLKFKPPLLPT